MNVHVQDHGGPAMGCRDVFSALHDDFGASPRETKPYTPCAARVATPKNPAAPTPVPRSSVERIAPTASGSRADRAGDSLPRRTTCKGRRPVYHDAASPPLDPPRAPSQ